MTASATKQGRNGRSHDMTNTTTAATVETLTAEVRTLVVGSRQVSCYSW